MAKTIPNLALKLRVSHTCTNIAYAALLGLLTLWSFRSASGFSLALWALVCLPLLILWPGMRKRRHRAYSWLCFVILLYFIKAVEGSMASTASWLDYAQLTLTVVIFISAMMTSRWLQYARQTAAAPNDVPMDKEPS